MGQQQLLLIVLATVLVGVATATGIDAYDTNRRKAEVDTVVNRLVTLSGIAQTWKLKPAALGGGQGREGFEGVLAGFDQMGWPSTPRSVTAYNPVAKRVERKTVGCYRPDDVSLYCPVPQFSGTTGTLVIYGMSDVTAETGDRFSSGDIQVVATAVVTGTGGLDITTDVLQ